MPRNTLDTDGAPLRAGALAHDEDADARLFDLEPEQESPFLRAQKRVPVRRGPLPRKASDRLKLALKIGAVLALVAFLLGLFYSYGSTSWRFRIDSSDQIEVLGTEQVPRAQVMEVMGGDIGRNIFFVPLEERRKQLEQVPWIESAAVMRLLPNRLRINLVERVPVAFARVGSRVMLTDASGVLMELPAGSAKRYSFPVITGMGENEPMSTRSARMNIFSSLMKELDSEGAGYSKEISEVDLGDPEDVKVITGDDNGSVLVHLGNGSFLDRYKVYVSHLQEWRRQFHKLESVDLRYGRQVIVSPDSRAVEAVPVKAAAKVQAAKGKKKAAARSGRKRR